jgi:hypothetical protein
MASYLVREKSVGYPPHVGCEDMALWSLSGGPKHVQEPTNL